MPDGSTDSELVDRIYECGFNPEIWPQVLRDTSKRSNFIGASLFVTNPDVTAWTSSRNSLPVADRFVAEGWYWRGKIMSRIHGSRHQGFLRDLDLCSEAELEEEPIYRDNWRKMGLWWGAATAFSLPTGEALSIALSRTAEQGPADAEGIRKLDSLRPHFARAAVMAARRRGFMAGSGRPILAATVISRASLEKSLERFLSCAPLRN